MPPKKDGKEKHVTFEVLKAYEKHIPSLKVKDTKKKNTESIFDKKK